MPRTITEIYNQIAARYVTEAAAVGITVDPSQWSLVNRKRIWANVQAYFFWVQDNLNDLHKQEVNEIIYQKNPHSPQWYNNHAKTFQYGFSLVPGKDYYNNTGIDEAIINASKICAYSAFVTKPYTRMKVAKRVGNGLGKFEAAELLAFIDFIEETKDAGVKLWGADVDRPATITSNDPDKLKLKLKFIYNPQVMKADGSMIDGSDPAPVVTAIRAFLSTNNQKNFNGIFSRALLEDAIQKVAAWSDHQVEQLQGKYGALPFTTINIDRIPDSGYYIIEDADLEITYESAQ